jgi:uncharacterized protein
MTFDDLSAPLGQQPVKPRRRLPVSVPQVIAAALALFFGAFVIWAIVAEDPFGGEPMVAVPIPPPDAAIAKKSEALESESMSATPGSGGKGAINAPAAEPPPAIINAAPAPTRTVTITDGKTGARQEVVIPSTGGDAAPAPQTAK